MKPALGIRAKLFLVSLLIILWVGFTAGIFLEYQLRTWAESRIESELFRHARAAREWMGREELVSIDVIDPIADRLGQATSVRITVIHQDGRVVGDSKLNRLEVEQVEKHAGRPEVMEAIEAGRGLSRRYSTTLGAHMLYVAVPFGGNQGGGVVRTAMPLTEVDHAVGELRLLLVVAGVLGTVFAILMSGMASHMFTRPLRSLLKHVRGVSGSSKGKGKAAGTRDEIEGLAGSFNQLTSELEEQVNALARERDRSTAIFEGMSESLFALNSERKVTLVNRAALELLGVTEAPIGRELPEMLGVPALDGLVTGVMEGKGGPLEFDYTCGTPRRILAHATPQRFSGGGVVVMHDITEVRKMEILRREFIANASHELRTPVSVIRANTETLLDGALDDRKVAHDLIEAMDRNAGRLTRIISDLMELARLDAGRYELSVTEVELREAVYMAMETLRGKARIRDITLESRIDPGLFVRADVRMLEHILLNLLDNAIKYIPTGERIVVWADKVERGVQLKVEDSGPGIGLSHREHLFERFYRVDPGRSRCMGGTGLGLAIVKELAEAMNGWVGMEPALPNGSIFWVCLADAGKG